MTQASAAPVFAHPANRDALARAEDRIAAHRATLDALEGEALARHAEGDDAAAVRAAAIAARFAHGAHCGRFASAPLERLLLDVGRRRIGGGRARPAAGPGRVLHVLTETYAVGGHTRLTQRWIELDDARRHSLFLTGPMNDVTAALARAAVASGGRVAMSGGAEPPLERARALRAAAADADLVVLHAHPFDPVPVLAFAEPDGRPPVVAMNHTDHAFWLGVGVADAVADFRPSGAAVTTGRRGVAAARSRLLPVPLPVTPPPDRRAARGRMRLDASRPLLASVAAAYKYGPVLEPTFPQLAAGALRAVPDAVCGVLGPEMDDRWTAAAATVGGRLWALGFNPDAATLLEAADLYVDSWPCSSATAVLEAGLHELPIVTLRPDAGAQGLLAADMTSVDGLLVTCADPEEHAAAIADLLADPRRRRDLGAQTRERILAEHTGAGWRDALEALIATARDQGPVGPPEDVADAPVATWECLLETLHAASGMGMTPQEAQRQEVARRRVPAGAATQVRILASPRADAAAVRATVDAFRDLAALGRVARCVVALAPDDVPAAVPLLEAALAEGEDVDVDLVPAPSPADLVDAADVVVDELSGPLAAAAAAAGAVLRVVAPVEAPRP
ncbi:MAG TPA: glycosyltransferase [Capillimicrobium sp.]|nr:glycosyltransferase [Capillimicrobium sp.]